MAMQIRKPTTISYFQGLLIILIILHNVGGLKAQSDAVDNWSLFEDFLDANHLKSGIFCPCELNRTTSSSYGVSPWIIDKMKRLNKRISFVYPPKQLDKYRHSHGIFLVADCENSNEYLRLADSYKLFGIQHKWLISVENGRLDDVLSEFETLDINVSSDVNFAVGRENVRKIYAIYKVRPVTYVVDKEYFTEEIGRWVKDSSFQNFKIQPFGLVRNRNNFMNKTFTGGIVLFGVEHNQTVEYLKSHANKHETSLNRRGYEVICTLGELYNFTVFPFPVSEWGWQREEGKWSGALGKVHDEEADFSLCASRFEFDRAKYFHYPLNLHYEIFSFNFRHPEMSQIGNVFVQPFNPTVWFCITAMIPVGGLFYWWNAKRERKYQRFLEKKLIFCLLIIWESILLQGPSKTFRSGCMNIVIISMVLFGFMVFQFYGAFIVGSLLTWQPHTITSLCALNASKLKFGMADVAYNRDFVTHPNDPYEADIYKRVGPLVKSGEEGFRKVAEGGYAFGMAINDAYYFLKKFVPPERFCELEYIFIRPKLYCTTVIKKGSVFRDHVDVGFLWLAEIGVLRYLDVFWTEEKPKCLHETDFAQVALPALVPAFKLLLFCCGVSLIVVNIEKVIFWINIKSRN